MENKQSNKSFAVRATHNTDGQVIRGGTPWRVVCASHREHAVKCSDARHETTELVGAWDCIECEKFDWAAQSQLRKALSDLSFSHVTLRGHYRDMGCVYHKDPTSPSGVRLACSFDPYNPTAMKIVELRRVVINDGPQSGALAGRGGW